VYQWLARRYSNDERLGEFDSASSAKAALEATFLGFDHEWRWSKFGEDSWTAEAPDGDVLEIARWDFPDDGAAGVLDC